MSAPPGGRTRPCAAAAQQTPCRPTQCAPEMPQPKQPRNSPSSPKKRKGRQKRRPSSQGGVCGERVKQTGVPPACMGSKGEPRRGHKHPDNAHQRSKLRITAKWATAQCLANTRFFRFLRRLAQPSNYNLLPYVQFTLTFCNDWTLSSDAPSAPMLCRRDISAVIRSRTLATSTETATFVAPEVSALKSPR